MASYLIGSSIVVFLVLNTIENVIHYNIGRHSGTGEFTIHNPSGYDWMEIVFTMIIFAVLQGVFTLIFDIMWQRWTRKNKESRFKLFL